MVATVSAHVVDLMEALRRRLQAGDFVTQHRGRPVDFTRQRQLTFPIVVLFAL